LKAIKHFYELYTYREVFYSLVLRDIKVRYKQSFFGAAWAIMQPFSMMLVFTIVFSYFLKVPSDNIPYPLFSYSALLPWTFFVSSINKAAPSLVANRDLITKIYFPREILPIAAVAASFFDFCMASLVFIALLIFFKVKIGIFFVLIFVPFFIQILLTFGIAFFVSSINVYYRDIGYLVPLLIQIWMFASPIMYSISSVPQKVKPFYLLNPMAGIIDSYRKFTIFNRPPDYYSLGVAFLVSLFIFVIGYLIFKKIEKEFADFI